MKELLITLKPNTMHYQIVFEGGGHLPMALEGTFTNHSIAKKAIASFKALEKQSKEKRDITEHKKEYTKVRAERVTKRKAKKESKETK